MTERADLITFRINLKTVRESMGLTQKELSIRCKLRQQKRVADIEEGRGNPSLDEILSICEAVNMPIDSMLKRQAQISINFI